MASISTGGGHGGKRALDHEVPLIPFIDLLLCCVMFLLVTAVWNRLASMEASLRTPSTETAPIAPVDEPRLLVRLLADRFVVATELGDRHEIPFEDGEPDLVALTEHLRPRAATTHGALTVIADDGIHFDHVIATMDALATAGFADVAMGDSM